MRSLLPVLGPRGPPGVQRRQRQQRSQDHLADLSRTLGLVGSCLCAGIPAKPAPHRYGYAPTSCLSWIESYRVKIFHRYGCFQPYLELPLGAAMYILSGRLSQNWTQLFLSELQRRMLKDFHHVWNSSSKMWQKTWIMFFYVASSITNIVSMIFFLENIYWTNSQTQVKLKLGRELGAKHNRIISWLKPNCTVEC